MANFSEMSGLKQWAAVMAGGALVTAGLHFTMFKSQREQNTVAQQKLQDKLHENAELEIERRIVPDEKEVDGFIRMMESEAQRAGIEIRRYTAKGLTAKDFYTEVPFELELDGPFYSVLGFFDRVGKLERIVNVSSLLVASTRKPGDAKAKHTYQYAPNESVVATCTATTFFSHDMEPVASTSGRPGQAATPVRR